MQLYEVPDSLTAEQAILAEPLANIVHLLRIVSPPPFFRLAIPLPNSSEMIFIEGAERKPGKCVAEIF
jgi:hypothetical protein